jgi:hypothetical protein
MPLCPPELGHNVDVVLRPQVIVGQSQGCRRRPPHVGLLRHGPRTPERAGPRAQRDAELLRPPPPPEPPAPPAPRAAGPRVRSASAAVVTASSTAASSVRRRLALDEMDPPPEVRLGAGEAMG